MAAITEACCCGATTDTGFCGLRLEVDAVVVALFVVVVAVLLVVGLVAAAVESEEEGSVLTYGALGLLVIKSIALCRLRLSCFGLLLLLLSL